MREEFDDLWEDYLLLSEKYRESFSVPQFGGAMIMFVSRMLFDCAPTHEQAVQLMEKNMMEGHQWSMKEKGQKDEHL